MAAAETPMPFPKPVARFNRLVTNRVTRRVAGWLPGFAIVEHTGRRSGRRYRTPVNAFRDGATITIALTYGGESEWVKNVLAAGGCTCRIRAQDVRCVDPRVVQDERRRRVPRLGRAVLGVLRVTEFLVLTEADAASP